MALASSPANPGTESSGITRDEVRVIFASSLGTVFEWYDFYLYGSLAAIIAKQFFSSLSEANAFIFALLSFSAGFAVRPFGAIVFGRIGDLIGRKYTFLVTIMIMGLSTTVVGLLPGYATIGIAAPIILIALRLLQGLALGGEYGGAATYVAEHAPHGKRGLFTAWIQTTATVGLFISLLVIYVCRATMGPKFDEWGWRIPFLISLLLLMISVYIRLQLQESPVFKRMKAEGKGSKAPLTESFLRWGNLKIVLLVALRRRRRPGGGLVHGHVLRALLPHADPQGRRADRERVGRHRARPRDAVLHPLRLALRQDRPQVDHHGGLPHRRAVLPLDLP
ncbi:MAG: MFS transporter [Anaeromyxobacteraceae bacterium]